MARRKSKQPEPKQTKPRSPKYPAIGLERAVEFTKIFYKEETTTTAATAVILKHLGYSEGSGTGFTALAALRSFGLIEGRHGDHRLTDRGLDIAIAERGTDKYSIAVQRAALSPMIHREVWDKYKGNLPSDTNLRYYLERERGFTAKAIKQFIPQLRASLAYAGVRSGQKIDDPSTGGDGGDGGQFPDQFASQFPDQVPRLAGQGKREEPMKGQSMQENFVVDGGVISIQWPATLSKAAYADVEDWFPILLRKLGRCVEDDNSARITDEPTD